MKEKRSFREYWNNSWNLFTLLYLFFSLLATFIIAICLIYAAKKPTIDSITFASIFLFSINIVVLLFRWGFAKGIISGIKSSHAERIIRKRAKARYGKNASINEQNRIIVEEREKYEQEGNKKSVMNDAKKTTNLVFYILLGVSLLTIIILVPYMVKAARG